MSEKIATREAYGKALVELGKQNDKVVVLDAEVVGRPKCILAHTVKGKGVSFMENQVGWHGKAPSEEQRVAALAELEG